MDRHSMANFFGLLFTIAIIAIGLWIEKNRKKRIERKQLSVREYYLRQYKPIAFDDRLPTLAKQGFALVDIAESAAGIDYINPLPTRAEKDNLTIGDLVKLKFVDNENNVERMWVEITERQGDLFKAEFANDSILFASLDHGDEVWFHANHVFETQN